MGGLGNVRTTLRPARVRRSAEELPRLSRLVCKPSSSRKRYVVVQSNVCFDSLAQQNRWEESLLQVVENYDARAKATGSYCDYGGSLISCLVHI